MLRLVLSLNPLVHYSNQMIKKGIYRARLLQIFIRSQFPIIKIRRNKSNQSKITNTNSLSPLKIPKQQTITEMATSIIPSLTFRLMCRFMLVTLLLSVAFYDVTSAASKKFIKGFILGALLAKNHYPVVVHEAHGKHKF